MGPASKDLLPLEKHDSSAFPLVLGRVKDFLGVISEANRRLVDAKENLGNYDIEVLDGNESQIIEMDLMLGVANLHTPGAIAAAESSIAGYKPVDSSSACFSGTDLEDSSDEDEDDDDDYDSDDGDEHDTENTSQGDVSTVTMGKNHSKEQSKRPKIVELP